MSKEVKVYILNKEQVLKKYPYPKDYFKFSYVNINGLDEVYINLKGKVIVLKTVDDDNIHELRAEPFKRDTIFSPQEIIDFKKKEFYYTGDCEDFAVFTMNRWIPKCYCRLASNNIDDLMEV